MLIDELNKLFTIIVLLSLIKQFIDAITVLIGEHVTVSLIIWDPELSFIHAVGNIIAICPEEGIGFDGVNVIIILDLLDVVPVVAIENWANVPEFIITLLEAFKLVIFGE